MFRFENEFYLYGLLIIPVLITAYIIYFYTRKKKWKKYGDGALISQLVPQKSATMQHIKFGFALGALIAFIFYCGGYYFRRRANI